MEMNRIQEIKTEAEAIFEEIRDIRQHLHRHPELSFMEEKTAAFISEKLNAWGIEHRRGVAGHGIHGVMPGKDTEGPCIFLRADIDALPIYEKTGAPYASEHNGIMHACGHDGHTASLLGALKILHTLRAEWSGQVSFVFQPAEEKLPGGASLMIKEGVLENPRPQAGLAQHVYTPLRAGSVGFRGGQYMASTDELYITFHGRGGHAATPQFNIDPITAGMHALLTLKKEIEEKKPAHTPMVLSFGKILAEGATNVIPDSMRAEGTLRTMDEAWRSQVHVLLQEIASRVAAEHGASAEVRIEKGYPVLFNDPELTAFCKKAAEEYLGPGQVTELDLRMTAEDFAYYTQYLPCCFYRLGTGNPEKGITANVHNPHFDIDEEALKTGMGLMVYLTLSQLGRK